MCSKRTTTLGSSLLCGVAIAALLLCFALPTSAQTWTTIFAFNGLNGRGGPSSGLTRDAAGNFYGTTYGGGPGGVPGGYGTVYKLTHQSAGWVLTTLYRFRAYDGDGPASRVIFGPDGALYGTTSIGANGYGTVYRLQRPASCPSGNCPWSETTLYAFQNGSDGRDPSGDLMFDRQGNIYSTAGGGPTNGSCNGTCGVVYKLTRSGQSWSYSVIYAFQGDDDGDGPNGGVVQDASGNLYGTTAGGGRDRSGTVYRLAQSGGGWTESIIYNFANDGDGRNPVGGLILDSAGILYGTTPGGGQYGAGTVYSISGGGFSVLASLNYPAGNGSDSALALDNEGNLYGDVWLGYVFKLTRSNGNWIFSQLGSGDPGMSTSLLVDSNGVVYGVDPGGPLYLYGAVFQITQ
jgi:uncharacterized repeat protein (TIGR03803 family)